MFQSVTVGSETDADVVVLGIFDDKQLATESLLHEDIAVSAALARRECTGEKDNLVETFRHENGKETRILLLGLGK